MKVRLLLVAVSLILGMNLFHAQAQVNGSGTKGKIPVCASGSRIS